MDLDDFISAVFCVVDEAIPPVLDGPRWRRRGPQPVLADSEAITMEVVGEYLGLEQDSALFAYFRRHYSHFFPALRTLHRTTFVRQGVELLTPYRSAQRDPRTGSILTMFPPQDLALDPQIAWRVQMAGSVFAIPTTHAVHAVDASMGQKLWGRLVEAEAPSIGIAAHMSPTCGSLRSAN